MAGFLDSKQRVIDMVLTGHGKMLLSHGELRFIYWAAFDDEIQYSSPHGSTGSLVQDPLVPLLSGSALTAYTEDPLQMEANQGYRLFGNLRGEDRCNVNRALLTVPPGQTTVPSASISYNRNVIMATQQPVVQEFWRAGSDGNPIDAYYNRTNMGVLRFGSAEMRVEAKYSNDSYPKNHKLEGFYVRVLASSSYGYHDQHHTLSDNSDIVFGADLKMSASSPGQ